MPVLLSVNVGAPRTPWSDGSVTGIDKRPATGPVQVRAPGQKGTGGSGLVGDHIGNRTVHGGNDQAVYAYAVEDLRTWATDLGRDLPPGAFGENLTTEGIDVTGALIGERWQIGERTVLEVTTGRIPCANFARWLGEQRWVKRFTHRAIPGAYLRVIEPGHIQAGDPIVVIHRPDHGVTVGMTFRALTTERHLLPRLLAAADTLHAEAVATATKAVLRARGGQQPVVTDLPEGADLGEPGGTQRPDVDRQAP